MRKGKKLLSMLLALAMVMGLSLTSYAEETTPAKWQNAKDTADLTIDGIDIPTGSQVTVTLYQIAEGVYSDTNGTNGTFIRYKWAGSTGTVLSTDGGAAVDFTVTGPTADQITGVLNKLRATDDTKISSLSTESFASTGDTEKYFTDSTEHTGKKKFTVTKGAGAYIAVITGTVDIYNPILLTASYDESGALVSGSIDLDNKDQKNYLFGTTAVAKYMTPSIDKTVSADATTDPGKASASVGEVLTYTLTPTLPSYPANAKNRTFFVSDSMTQGLTFQFASLNITLTDGPDVTAEFSDDKKAATFYYEAADNTKVTIAQATEQSNGFYLCFTYNGLIENTTTEATYQPIVTYTARVNEDAVVGGDGNKNSVTMYYANDPSSGSTHTDPNSVPDTGTDPDPSGGSSAVSTTQNSSTVYTYRIAVRKIENVNENTTKNLADAIFGIYSDANCKKLVEKVQTDANGYGVSNQLAAGTYYVKELIAPKGYSLNADVATVTVNSSNATAKVTTTVTKRTYTTTQPDGVESVGWLWNNTFYTGTNSPGEGAEKAYLDTTTVTTSENTVVATGSAGDGTVLTTISDTKLSTLPATGGIGTTIFTVLGCLLMITAAGLYFASRKKNEK